MTERLLTPIEASAHLSISPQTLATWRWRGEPKLRFVRIGRLIRYRTSDIAAFLESQTRTSTSDPGEATR